jgi:hypothetical protein
MDRIITYFNLVFRPLESVIDQLQLADFPVLLEILFSSPIYRITRVYTKKISFHNTSVAINFNKEVDDDKKQGFEASSKPSRRQETGFRSIFKTLPTTRNRVSKHLQNLPRDEKQGFEASSKPSQRPQTAFY